MANEEETSPQVLPASRRMRSTLILVDCNTYGIFFAIGLLGTNLSRVIPYGFMVYCAIASTLIGMAALKAEVDIKKIVGLALAVSLVGFWDVLVQLINQPVFLFMWLLPLWQVVAYLISGVLLFIGVLGLFMPKS